MLLDRIKACLGGRPSKPDAASLDPVLVVDDEPLVREVARRMLEAAGYTVLEACGGADALEKIAPDTRLLLLVSDVNMPGLSGDELARQFRIRQPDLNCLFLTGFVDRLFEGRTILWEGEAFLEKPFTDRGLWDAVSLLAFGRLGGPTPAASQMEFSTASRSSAAA